MFETLLTVLTNKNLFTGIILTLYCLQVLFQAFVIKDYDWAGYWFGAVIITFFATRLAMRALS